MSSLAVRVYYEDSDAGGVVYHANYFKYIERGRTEHLRKLGFELSELEEIHGLVFVVKSVKANYLNPAFLDDAIEVETSIELVRHASLIFAQKIMNIEKNISCPVNNVGILFVTFLIKK